MIDLTNVESISYEDLTLLLTWRLVGGRPHAAVHLESTGAWVGEVYQRSSGRWVVGVPGSAPVVIETYGDLRDILGVW